MADSIEERRKAINQNLKRKRKKKRKRSESGSEGEREWVDGDSYLKDLIKDIKVTYRIFKRLKVSSP